MPEQDSALAGVQVLDLSRVLAGPWASQLLADLGADVIKVERPGGGDDTRAWGPPWFGEAEGEAAYFTCANRGKRSIAVDIADSEGAALVRKLAVQSDVLIENFKVDGLAKYGLDYDALSAVNPRLIYCSITGFGQSGPYAHLPGYDFIIQAMGGLMSVTGEPGGQPMKVGVALVDILTGLYASNGILAALHHRTRTGLGQQIDVNLLDVQVAALANQMANVQATGRNPARRGNAHPNIVPYQAFAVSDGQVAIAVGNDGQFLRLCDLLDRPDLAADVRYATNAARLRHRDALIGELARAFAESPATHWLTSLEAAGIPAGPVNDIIDVLADPHVQARGMAIVMERDDGSTVPGIACPLRLSRSTTLASRAPPALGQHGDEIRAELGAALQVETLR